ncbi:hypothetical protein [Burkholderia sp. BC1]|uniref:hypothetical protein n=1 Tax=Burkholderia sp. BC1 TaxID=1095370 RepID=UPI004043B783
MSTTAIIFVLFRQVPTLARLSDLEAAISARTGVAISRKYDDYERLIHKEDDDWWADLWPDGSLRYRGDGAGARAQGAPSLDHRLYRIDYLSRYWNVTGYRDGPGLQYARTLQTLIEQDDVEGVWYTDSADMHNKLLAPSTHDTVRHMIDECSP